jgi:hypothetical protein
VQSAPPLAVFCPGCRVLCLVRSLATRVEAWGLIKASSAQRYDNLPIGPRANSAVCLSRASSRRKAASHYANAARQEQPRLPTIPATCNNQGPRLPPVSSDLNPVFAPQATPPQVSQRWKPKEKRRGVKGSLARAEKRLLNPEVQARAEQYKQSFNVKSLQRGQ